MRTARYIAVFTLLGIAAAVLPAFAGQASPHRKIQAVFDDGSVITVSDSQLNYTAQTIVQKTDTHEVELKGDVHIVISQDGRSVANVVSKHVRLVQLDE